MTSSCEDDHPEESHDEAEDRDKHHPAQRHRGVHAGRRHQDPHQTTEHLQRWIMIYDIWDICLYQSDIKLTTGYTR